jgi:type II secretory pathway predicted ATPase ExeA
MYEAYWKLKERPFRNTPDPAFLYRSPQHQEALMKLTYAVNERIGGALLVGDYGCGKTILCHALLRELGPEIVAVTCNAMPEMTPMDILRSISRKTVATETPSRRTELLGDALMEQIEHALVENRRDGRHTLLIVDEAHMIAEQNVLETVRVLLNFAADGEPLLSLVLSGHPELAGRIAASKQLLQRIPVAARVEALPPGEIEAYVGARMSAAGGAADVFKSDAIRAIAGYSGGIPRRINTVCDVSLALGAAQNAPCVDAALVAAAASRFGIAPA